MPQRLPVVWSFVNAKGGVGKSTLAVQAAVWHARRGASVVLVDADAQQASSVWLGEVQQPGVQVVPAADAAAVQRAVDAARRRRGPVVPQQCMGVAHLPGTCVTAYVARARRTSAPVRTGS